MSEGKSYCNKCGKELWYTPIPGTFGLCDHCIQLDEIKRLESELSAKDAEIAELKQLLSEEQTDHMMTRKENSRLREALDKLEALGPNMVDGLTVQEIVLEAKTPAAASAASAAWATSDASAASDAARAASVAASAAAWAAWAAGDAARINMQRKNLTYGIALLEPEEGGEGK